MNHTLLSIADVKITSYMGFDVLFTSLAIHHAQRIFAVDLCYVIFMMHIISILLCPMDVVLVVNVCIEWPTGIQRAFGRTNILSVTHLHDSFIIYPPKHNTTTPFDTSTEGYLKYTQPQKAWEKIVILPRLSDSLE